MRNFVRTPEWTVCSTVPDANSEVTRPLKCCWRQYENVLVWFSSVPAESRNCNPLLTIGKMNKYCKVVRGKPVCCWKIKQSGNIQECYWPVRSTRKRYDLINDNAKCFNSQIFIRIICIKCMECPKKVGKNKYIYKICCEKRDNMQIVHRAPPTNGCHCDSQVGLCCRWLLVPRELQVLMDNFIDEIWKSAKKWDLHCNVYKEPLDGATISVIWWPLAEPVCSVKSSGDREVV